MLQILRTQLVQVEPAKDRHVIGLHIVNQARIVEFAACRMHGEAKRRVFIGRARRCDIKLDDPTVSLIHCYMERGDHGRWTVVEQKSRNGLYINDLRVPRAELKPGMRLRLGNTELIAVGADGKLPITARTYTTFLALAKRLYGSERKAEAKIGRSRGTIGRGSKRWEKRGKP